MLDGEKELITRAIGGEAEAFGKLYDHYLPKIYRFILMKVSRREEAEDLTHQVFLSAWQNINTYQSRGYPFSSWLYRIARNAVIDYMRTKKETFTIEDIENEPRIEPAVEHQIDLKLGIAPVFEAVRKLASEQQEVIMMKFVDELSNQEIAEALGKSEGAIRLIQHRALNKLKRFLNA
ncbi:MAG: sigma-70 family RNA polymerase sigma factor [Parcubacteria group bacterium]|nr:sigma-70 family RNA polymerase sigma factor [Parcubacteria group bacterium]